MRTRSLLVALLAAAGCCTQTPPQGQVDAGGDGGTGGTTGGGGGPGCDAGPGPGGACTPPSSAGAADSCAPCGYVCDANAGSKPGSCELPATGQPCLPSTGCAGGDICALVQQSPPAYACFQACATSADCTLTSSSCQPYGSQLLCNANLCGPNVPASATSSGPSYFASCDATPDAGGGYCLPEQTSLGTLGFCFAGGSAATRGCTLDRGDGGALCPPGSFCLPDLQSGQSRCFQLCAATAPFLDAGPGCGAGAVCLPYGVGAGPNDFGVCLSSCSGSCPTGLSCQPVVELPDAGTLCVP